MAIDLFVSYAQTNDGHRAWVRLLASHLHLLGYDVRIDASVNYGSSLTGFMRTVTGARHVLMICDENYVHRADNVPTSGVAIENEWIKSAYQDREPGWLAVLFVDNPAFRLPSWLADHKPKGFSFNDSDAESSPGSEQIEDLWRWIEDLPADKSNATPLSVLRERAARLERIANQRDPAFSASPALRGEVTFAYADNPSGVYTLGHGDLEFKVMFSEAGYNSVYVLRDYVVAVGIVHSDAARSGGLATFLSPGRLVTPSVGQTVVLMNAQGILCTLHITEAQREINGGGEYIRPFVAFAYEILADA